MCRVTFRGTRVLAEDLPFNIGRWGRVFVTVATAYYYILRVMTLFMTDTRPFTKDEFLVCVFVCVCGGGGGGGGDDGCGGCGGGMVVICNSTSLSRVILE